ncbi:MAG: penicillin-binding protein, partial [Bacteroidia bacterium]|nr:penicillin-binding protein [Bacteroidia bacterium]
FSSTSMGSGANTALPIVASIFKNISYWKRPLLTNFEYDFEYFPCRPFLEMSAEESQTFSLTDSIYLQELHMKNLDTIQTTSNETDSILKLLPLQIQRDTIKKDTIQ